jgi:homocysteine S-methyltransferase
LPHWTPAYRHRRFFFMANCCHAAHLRAAFSSANEHAAELLRRRVIGLQANTSAKDASELDKLPVLDSELPERFASDLLALRRDFGLRILGGCCGSDERHIAEVARHLVSTHRVDGGD